MYLTFIQDRICEVDVHLGAERLYYIRQSGKRPTYMYHC